MLGDAPTAARTRARLRRATEADARGAAALIAAALAEYGLPFEPDGRDADVATFGSKVDHDDLVAEETTAAMIGVVSVGPQGEVGRAWLSKLFVARAARGHGVGRALLEAAHDAARTRGYRIIGLRTRLVFREALALYESAGYTRGPASERGDVVFERAL